jgi:hypothetical protein
MLNTPMPSKFSPIFVVRGNTPRPATMPLPELDKPGRAIEDTSSTRIQPRNMPIVPIVPFASQVMRKSPPLQRAPHATNPSKHPSKIEIICIALVFLLISGGLIWFLYISSTSVSITKPVQNFSNTHLGVTLQYPNKWIEVSNTAQSTISFYDNSSHTTQIHVSLYEADQDVAQFIQEQALQLGMTNSQLSTSMPFAGVTWQQLQGHLVEKGADYTGTIFATQHNYHLYMIAQFAPQGVYATEEKLIFMPFCTSFHFL